MFVADADASSVVDKFGVSIFKGCVRVGRDGEVISLPPATRCLSICLGLSVGDEDSVVQIKSSVYDGVITMPIPGGDLPWKPYFLAVFPIMITVHPLSLSEGSRVEESLLGFVQRKYIERLQASARLNGFPLGFPTARWALAGISAVENRSSTSLTYTLQRSSLVATRRFPFVTFFIPGMCLMNGCFAYEVRKAVLLSMWDNGRNGLSIFSRLRCCRLAKHCWDGRMHRASMTMRHRT